MTLFYIHHNCEKLSSYQKQSIKLSYLHKIYHCPLCHGRATEHRALYVIEIFNAVQARDQSWSILLKVLFYWHFLALFLYCWEDFSAIAIDKTFAVLISDRRTEPGWEQRTTTRINRSRPPYKSTPPPRWRLGWARLGCLPPPTMSTSTTCFIDVARMRIKLTWSRLSGKRKSIATLRYLPAACTATRPCLIFV